MLLRKLYVRSDVSLETNLDNLTPTKIISQSIGLTNESIQDWIPSGIEILGRNGFKFVIFNWLISDVFGSAFISLRLITLRACFNRTWSWNCLNRFSDATFIYSYLLNCLNKWLQSANDRTFDWNRFYHHDWVNFADLHHELIEYSRIMLFCFSLFINLPYCFQNESSFQAISQCFCHVFKRIYKKPWVVLISCEKYEWR